MSDKKVEVEEELEFTEKFKEVEDIYEYYRKQIEEKKYPPEKLKVVILDGKEVAYNPEEEEDPRLMKVIMEAEKEECVGPFTIEGYRKYIEETVEDKDSH